MEIPCAHRIVVSGTPIQNNLKVMSSLVIVCTYTFFLHFSLVIHSMMLEHEKITLHI